MYLFIFVIYWFNNNFWEFVVLGIRGLVLKNIGNIFIFSEFIFIWRKI